MTYEMFGGGDVVVERWKCGTDANARRLYRRMGLLPHIKRTHKIYNIPTDDVW